MMRTALIPALALAAIATAPAAAATITPVAVSASNTFSFFGEYKPENLINGSGLTGGLHDANYANMWMTDLGVQTATLTFDLGASYDLNAANIWNYNFGTPGFFSTLERGVKDFTLAFSTDGTTFTDAFAGTLSAGTGAPMASQDFALDGTARFVRLGIVDAIGRDQFSSVGLSEVRFDGTAAVAAVPEPAAWGLMIAGFGLVGGALRRRNGLLAHA